MQQNSWDTFFFKHASELHIIILIVRRKKGKSPYNTNPQSWDTRLRGKDKYQGTFVPSKGLAIMFT
jgi:hypothetical protein